MEDVKKIEAIRAILKRVEKTANNLEEHQWVDWNRVLEDIVKAIND